MRTPDVQHVVLQFEDGTIGVMAFVTCERGPDGEANWTREASDENVRDEVARSSFPAEKGAVVRYALVDTDTIPADRTYRAAWRYTPEDGFHHDMEHARELHRDLLRQERAYRLADLDVAYMRADEAGDKEAKARIAAEKQALRDVTGNPEIDAAQTVDDLHGAARDVLADQG